MSKFTFRLSGFGHLKDIQRTPVGMLVKINVLFRSTDEVELECIVKKPELVNQLDHLQLACQSEEDIVVNFIVHYKNLLHCHAGLTKQDPKQMVKLKGQLTSCQGWLRSKDLPPATSPRDI